MHDHMLFIYESSVLVLVLVLHSEFSSWSNVQGLVLDLGLSNETQAWSCKILVIAIFNAFNALCIFYFFTKNQYSFQSDKLILCAPYVPRDIPTYKSKAEKYHFHLQTFMCKHT